MAWRDRLAVVGAGGGSVPFDFFKVPSGAQLVTSLNGGSIALQEVVGLAALGRLKSWRTAIRSAPRSGRTMISSTGRLVGRGVLMPQDAGGADRAATASSPVAATSGQRGVGVGRP